jgi:small subunit ribosomal protein S17
MQGAVVVRVTRRFQHSLYDRYMQSSKKFYAHDERGEAKQGDTVRIVESRPLSKLKRWRLAEVISRSTRVH